MVGSLKTLLNRPGGAGRGAVFSFGLRIASTGLAFVTISLLGRLLSLEGYGIYASVLEWLNFLAIPTALGMDRLMVPRDCCPPGAGRVGQGSWVFALG